MTTACGTSARCCSGSAGPHAKRRPGRPARLADSRLFADQAAAPAFLSSRLTLSALALSFSSEVLSSQLSRPPLCSTERSPWVETRNLKLWSSFSLSSVTFCRLGRKTRLVLLLAWLTLWPTWRPLPVSSQMRDMVRLSKIWSGGVPESGAHSGGPALRQPILGPSGRE